MGPLHGPLGPLAQHLGMGPLHGPLGPLALTDLARLPGLLCLGSAELVLPCSLPCVALPRPPASLIRGAAFGRLHKGGRRFAPPPFVDSLMRLAGGRGKAKQGRLQGKTNSAEPRQSKPGSRAKSAGPKVGLRPTRWLGQQVWLLQNPPKVPKT